MFMQVDPEEVERIKAENHARRERFIQFVENMAPKDLGVFYEIISATSQQDNPAEALNYLLGQASMVMRLKHNTCVCGEDHDGEALQETADAIQAERAAKEATAHQAAMDEYNLMVGPDGKLVCKGCGLHYVSLEDRMLRKPGMDGCHGCQLKSAHG